MNVNVMLIIIGLGKFTSSLRSTEFSVLLMMSFTVSERKLTFYIKRIIPRFNKSTQIQRIESTFLRIYNTITASKNRATLILPKSTGLKTFLSAVFPSSKR